MTYVYWTLLAIAIIFGIKPGVIYLIESWYENGKRFTLLLIVFAILFLGPGVVHMFAPSYFALSVYPLIIFSVGFVLYRALFKINNGDEEEQEG